MQTYENWIMTDWKTFERFDNSQFQQRHSDSRAEAAGSQSGFLQVG